MGVVVAGEVECCEELVGVSTEGSVRCKEFGASLDGVGAGVAIREDEEMTVEEEAFGVVNVVKKVEDRPDLRGVVVRN
jgi:hypothetical protein